MVTARSCLRMPLWSETTGALCLPAVQNRSLSPAELDLWDESSRSTTMNIWRAAWPKQKKWNFQRFPFLGFFGCLLNFTQWKQRSIMTIHAVDAILR